MSARPPARSGDAHELDAQARAGVPAERHVGSDEKEFAEESDSIWRITFGPLIWAVHFGASYAATAIVCAKGGDVDVLRTGVVALTAAALAGILYVGRRAWRQWDFLDDRDYEHELAREEDRHEFLGHAAFLLAIVSFIGVAYVALPTLVIGSCA